MRKQKKIMGSRLMLMKGDQSSATPSYLSDNGRDVILFKSVCSNSYFHIMQSIRDCRMPKGADYYQRVLCLEARMGHIEYSLLEPEENVEVLEEPICLRVHILSSEEEFIDIRLREDRYIRSIVEEIGAKNSIDVIYDWALFLQVEGGTIRMPPDEKILAFTAKWKVEIASG